MVVKLDRRYAWKNFMEINAYHFMNYDIWSPILLICRVISQTLSCVQLKSLNLPVVH